MAQTGTGKTGAYVLPLLQKLKGRHEGQPRIAILVPTKEVALQVLLAHDYDVLAATHSIATAAKSASANPTGAFQFSGLKSFPLNRR